MKATDDELEILEEEIKENIEWLSDVNENDYQCITIENLEGILTRFFGRKISLSL
tara:strand:- start:136 stop:300 length:165 start_codon:yes stop_codon:yes gene_type:complete